LRHNLPWFEPFCNTFWHGALPALARSLPRTHAVCLYHDAPRTSDGRAVPDRDVNFAGVAHLRTPARRSCFCDFFYRAHYRACEPPAHPLLYRLRFTRARYG